MWFVVGTCSDSAYGHMIIIGVQGRGGEHFLPCLVGWLAGRSVVGWFVAYLNLSIFTSQWPRGLRRRSTAARLLRSWVRIPPAAWMSVVSVLCCQVDVSATS